MSEVWVMKEAKQLETNATNLLKKQPISASGAKAHFWNIAMNANDTHTQTRGRRRLSI